eukprot:TRINITY_DN2370_c0_g1_i9.p1 TRINITY_DN2370_c0_g1~~TRINITY_DN2370_c0_g1_i9.p1  ORF type:complete len:1022 (-),score=237.34 TRINITY_DN2370_c0_g1_i9:186-3251(-)
MRFPFFYRFAFLFLSSLSSLCHAYNPKCVFTSQDGINFDLSVLTNYSDISVTFPTSDTLYWNPCSATNFEPQSPSTMLVSKRLGGTTYLGPVSSSTWNSSIAFSNYSVNNSDGSSGTVHFICQNNVVFPVATPLVMTGLNSYVFAYTLNCSASFAPYIKSIDFSRVYVGSRGNITITGGIFGANTTNVQVNWGSDSCTPITVDWDRIVADCPARFSNKADSVSLIVSAVPSRNTTSGSASFTTTLTPSTSVPSTATPTTTITTSEPPTSMTTTETITTEIQTTTESPTTEVPTSSLDTTEASSTSSPTEISIGNLSTIIGSTSVTSVIPPIEIPSTSSLTSILTSVPTEVSIGNLSTIVEVTSEPITVELPTSTIEVPTKIVSTELPTVVVSPNATLPLNITTSPTIQASTTVPIPNTTVAIPSTQIPTTSAPTTSAPTTSAPTTVPPVVTTSPPKAPVTIQEAASTLYDSVNLTLTTVEAKDYLTTIGDNHQQLSDDGKNLFKSLELLVSAVLRDGASNFTLESDRISIAAKSVESDASLSLFTATTTAFVPSSVLKSEKKANLTAVLSFFTFNPLPTPSEEVEIYSNVTSLAFYDEKGVEVNVEDTEELINITIPYYSSVPDGGFSCLFWDQENNTWSTNGCQTSLSSPGFVSCLCSHLTNFTLGGQKIIPKSASSVVGNQQKYPIHMIVGIVVGAAVLVLVIIGIFVFLLRREKLKKMKKAITLAEVEMEDAPRTISGFEVQIQDKIQSGSHSLIYKGSYGMNQVVIKWPHKGFKLDREAFIMKQLHHPNICQYFGSFISESEELCLVMEYMEEGTLHELIQNFTVKEETLMNITFQIASAITYLQSAGYIHGDICAKNVLLRHSGSYLFSAKLSDYGTAVHVSEKTRPQYSDMAVRWTAPELLSNEKAVPTFECDIWSLGVLLWECGEAGKTPYCEMDNAQVVKQVVKIGNALESSNWTSLVREITDGCFVKEPGFRIKISKIAVMTSKWSSGPNPFLQSLKEPNADLYPVVNLPES